MLNFKNAKDMETLLNKEPWMSEHMKKYPYMVRCKETGDEIEGCFTDIQAKRVLETYEIEDKHDGNYIEGFYEIAKLNEATGDYEKYEPINIEAQRIQFGKMLADLRKEKGYTIRDMEREANIYISNISRIENGKTPLTIDTIFKYLNALGYELTIQPKK